MQSLSDSFVVSLNEQIQDVLVELGEAGLDSFLDDEIIKQVPVLSTLTGVYRIGKGVWELNLYRQMVFFLKGIQDNTVEEDKRLSVIRRFKEKPSKERNKELEYIILIVSRFVENNRSRLLSKLYIAYLYGRIEWNQFVSYSEIIDRLLPGDVEELLIGQHVNINDYDISDSLLRLQSLGLIKSISKGMSTPTTLSSIRIPANVVKDYQLTSFGEVLRDCLAQQF